MKAYRNIDYYVCHEAKSLYARIARKLREWRMLQGCFRFTQDKKSRMVCVKKAKVKSWSRG